MKKSIKFISIMLMLSMLLFAVPIAHAAEPDQQPNIRETLIQKVLRGHEDQLLVYKELYTHKDQDGNNDWTLIFARTTFYDIHEAGFAYDFGGVYYKQPGMADDPLQICYTIYDHKTNEFCDFLKAWNPEWYPEHAGTIRNYEGLHEVFGDVYYSVIKEEFVNTYMSGNEDSVKEFKELYYHKEDGYFCDWALVYCETSADSENTCPFETGYMVYSYYNRSDLQKFYGINEALESGKFEGLQEAVDKYCTEPDQQPNIKDVLIQKVLHGREENLLVYKELYTHKDQDGNNDWTLIFARTTFYDIHEAGFAYDFGGVYYKQPGMADDPLQICYTIYDHKTNEFCDFLKAWNPEWYPEHAGTIRNYEGLHEVFGDVYYSVIKEIFIQSYPNIGEDGVKEFKELYYHKKDGYTTCDWALVYCETNVEQPGISAHIFGDRVLYRTSASVPFTYGYGVYNYRTKSFVDLVEAWDDDKYEGLHEAFEARNAGTLLGDANKDNQLTIGDATKIQRYLARMIDDNAVGAQSAENGKTETEYICDFNKDGTVNISDVTAIQKKLAKY